MPWLLAVALMASLVVVLVPKVPRLRSSTHQPGSRRFALGGAIAGLTPLMGLVSREYLSGPAHNIGVAVQGLMIGLALCMIWKGRRVMRVDR